MDNIIAAIDYFKKNKIRVIYDPPKIGASNKLITFLHPKDTFGVLFKTSKSIIMINKIGEMPTKPGIYFFKDAKNQIIYIGKAKSIRKRVRSYFSSTHLKDPKTKILVKNI